MSEEKKPAPKPNNQQPVQVDATAEQVRRLVEKLKDKKAEEKDQKKENRT